MSIQKPHTEAKQLKQGTMPHKDRISPSYFKKQH